MRMDHDDVRGIFALMPTPATEASDRVDPEFTLDLEETARATDAHIRSGVDCIMLNGTFGEGSTLTLDEWKQFTRQVIETANGRVPIAAGPTALGTQSTIERARFAERAGADALFLGRPMWCELSPEAIVDYYRDIASEFPELGLIIYDNPIHFKGAIQPDTWRELADIPNTLAAKYAGGVDRDPTELNRELEGDFLIMPIDLIWSEMYQKAPDIAVACWSPSAPCGPLPLVELRNALFAGDFERADELSEMIHYSSDVWWPDDEDEFETVFSRYNIPMEKLRINAAGFMDSGPSRPPYHLIPDEYGEAAIESGERWREIVTELERDVQSIET